MFFGKPDDMELVISKIDRGRTAKLIFSIIVHENTRTTTQCPTINIGQMAEVLFQFTQTTNSTITSSVSIKRHDSLKKPNVEVKVLSNNKVIRKNCGDEWLQFISMGEYKRDSQCLYVNMYVLIVKISVSITDRPSFEPLYKELDFVDFNLGPEGSCVPVHKIVLAVTSDVFKTMLNGQWKETTNGCLDVKGVTRQTLEHLKKYMYLGVLPDYQELLPLVLIAKCYMIQPLETLCIDKLARTVKGENLMDLLEFAVDNRLVELIFTIFQNTPDQVVQVASEARHKAPALTDKLLKLKI